MQNVSVNLGADTSICFSDPMPEFNASNLGASYSWSKNGNALGGTDSILLASGPGTYSVTVAYGSCTASDSIELELLSTIPINLGPDTNVCTRDTLPYS